MKIGIMGGTFNPIHNGHLSLAAAAKEAANLDKIWFMPSGLPAHKSNSDLLSAELRLNMVRLALKNNKDFVESSFEIDRPGFTYTADTMEALTKEYPMHEFFFIIGGDSLMKFHHWVKPEVISAHTTLLAAGRDGYSQAELLQQSENLYQLFGTKVQVIDMPAVQISSNSIRTYCKQKKYQEFRKYVPEDVFQYLIEHQLYQ